MLIISILNSLPKRYRPKESYMTIGYYQVNPLIKPRGFHAWAYAKTSKGEYIADATAPWVVNNKSKIGKRYHPIIGVYPYKIALFKEIGEVI